MAALALDIAGAALADPSRDELELAAELADALRTGHEPSIIATLARSLSRLDDPGWDFMRLASELAAAPVPATLIGAVLIEVDHLDPTAGRHRTLRALRNVDLLSLAEPTADQDGDPLRPRGPPAVGGIGACTACCPRDQWWSGLASPSVLAHSDGSARCW